MSLRLMRFSLAEQSAGSFFPRRLVFDSSGGGEIRLSSHDDLGVIAERIAQMQTEDREKLQQALLYGDDLEVRQLLAAANTTAGEEGTLNGAARFFRSENPIELRTDDRMRLLNVLTSRNQTQKAEADPSDQLMEVLWRCPLEIILILLDGISHGLRDFRLVSYLDHAHLAVANKQAVVSLLRKHNFRHNGLVSTLQAIAARRASNEIRYNN